MKATFLLTGFFPKLRLKFIYAINRKLIIFRKFHEKPKYNLGEFIAGVSRSCQNTCVIKTGLSEFHLMTMNVMKKAFKKF